MYHWTIGSLPELGHLPSEARRAIIGRIKPGRIYGQMIFKAVVFAGFVALAATLLIEQFLVGGWVAATLGLVSGTCVGMILYQVQIVSIRKEMRSEIRRLLAGDRLPVCLRCGYNLDHAASPRCPECGARADVPPASVAKSAESA